MVSYRALLPVLFLAAPIQAAEPSRAQVEFFEKKIRPVLVQHCYECHSDDAKKAKGGLKLDTRSVTRKGGDSGPGVVPGKPKDSLVLTAIRYHDDDLRMPPKDRLPETVAKDFESWITSGAVDPRDDVQASHTKPAASLARSTIDYAKGRKFWAFQLPRKVGTGIDGLLDAKIVEAGLTKAPPADPRTLIRRLTFDLTGLPPTIEETRAFERAWRAKPQAALKAAVDRLLASPAHGERWARVWLDVARFAEDQAHIVGADASLTYPNAHLYRDWVIKALNEDLPYDRFVTLQIAADLVEGEKSPNIAALGFLGLGPKYYNRGTLAVMADEWEDRVDVVGRGLLGLTVACARCHDHKFDPIGTADYYSLAGVFSSTEMYNRTLTDKSEKLPTGQAKAPKDAMHIVRDMANPADLTVFIRGNVDSKGPVVNRRFLPVLCSTEPKPFTQGSGRKELAEAIANTANPLTARVIVNRVWAQYFGRGLVNTPSNFGSLGDRPTHPELLDDLAVRFMENRWSLKWLHREIVSTAAYGRSSQLGTRNSEQKDPENVVLSHMPRRRLSVEQWRDAVLMSTGALDAKVQGGTSFDPLDPKQTRRTVYSAVSRLDLNKLLAMFDFPDPNATADRRVETITPLQKMFVLNSPFMVARAEELAARLAKDVPGDGEKLDAKRIELAYQLLYSRPATSEEITVGQAYLAPDRKARWARYAHALLAANEMMFVD